MPIPRVVDPDIALVGIEMRTFAFATAGLTVKRGHSGKTSTNPRPPQNEMLLVLVRHGDDMDRVVRQESKVGQHSGVRECERHVCTKGW